MSNPILVEPSSQRGDNKVWVWRYADPVNVPVRVNLYRNDVNSGNTYASVPTSFYVRFLIKADLRDDNPVMEKVFPFIAPSLFLVSFATDEVIQLRAGKGYYVGVALYDENDNFIRSLISDLPLRVEKSVLSNSVF